MRKSNILFLLLISILLVCLTGCNCDGDEPAPAPATSSDVTTPSDVATSSDIPAPVPPVDILALLGSVLTACVELMQIELTVGILTFSFWQLFLYSIVAGVVLYLIFLWVKK